MCGGAEAVGAWGKNSLMCFGGLVGRCTAKRGLVSSSGRTVGDSFFLRCFTYCRRCCVSSTLPVTRSVTFSLWLCQSTVLAEAFGVLLSAFLRSWVGRGPCQPLVPSLMLLQCDECCDCRVCHSLILLCPLHVGVISFDGVVQCCFFVGFFFGFILKVRTS